MISPRVPHSSEPPSKRRKTLHTCTLCSLSFPSLSSLSHHNTTPTHQTNLSYQNSLSYLSSVLYYTQEISVSNMKKETYLTQSIVNEYEEVYKVSIIILDDDDYLKSTVVVKGSDNRCVNECMRRIIDDLCMDLWPVLCINDIENKRLRNLEKFENGCYGKDIEKVFVMDDGNGKRINVSMVLLKRLNKNGNDYENKNVCLDPYGYNLIALLKSKNLSDKVIRSKLEDVFGAKSMRSIAPLNKNYDNQSDMDIIPTIPTTNNIASGSDINSDSNNMKKKNEKVVVTKELNKKNDQTIEDIKHDSLKYSPVKKNEITTNIKPVSQPQKRKRNKNNKKRRSINRPNMKIINRKQMRHHQKNIRRKLNKSIPPSMRGPLINDDRRYENIQFKLPQYIKKEQEQNENDIRRFNSYNFM